VKKGLSSNSEPGVGGEEVSERSNGDLNGWGRKFRDAWLANSLPKIFLGAKELQEGMHLVLLCEQTRLVSTFLKQVD
jgi:hypothetical protein